MYLLLLLHGFLSDSGWAGIAFITAYVLAPLLRVAWKARPTSKRAEQDVVVVVVVIVDHL